MIVVNSKGFLSMAGHGHTDHAVPSYYLPELINLLKFFPFLQSGPSRRYIYPSQISNFMDLKRTCLSLPHT